MKFLSPINVNTEYTLPFVDGTNGQVLTTDGNGAVYWGSVSAGATNLNALTDVELTTPTSGQILRYELPPGGQIPIWRNVTPNYLTPNSSINALVDVTISSPAVGQLLRWNGTYWLNWTPNYLTAESDTLATVTSRGATTTGNITVNGAAFATSFSATGLLITNADTSGSLQPDQGSPANKIYSFRWAGNEQGYIDTDAKITFAGFKTPTGTASQFLKANGTVDSSVYITSSALSGYATQTWVNANFYEQGLIDDFFVGAEPILGYNKANWDTAFGWGNHASAGYLTSYENNYISNVRLVETTLSFTGEGSGFTGDINLSLLPFAASSHTHAIADVTGLQTALDGKVPTSRTITINGTALDLSADRSWTISSADGYISDVRLAESTLSFSGEGSAFNGSVDLSTLPFQPAGSYLTAEADTLATVTARGASTTSVPSFNAVYTSGNGDFTNTDFPSYKINPASGYWRIVHLSQETTISGVYNYQSGKNVYWGEPGDAGQYLFRGRTLIVSEGNVGIGTTSPQHGLHVSKNQNQVAAFQSPNPNTWIDLISTAGTWSMGATSSNTWAIYQRGAVNATEFEVTSSAAFISGQKVATQDWVQAQGYLTSETDSQTLEWDAPNKNLSITNGNTVTLDGLATEDFVTSQGYITGEADTLDTVTARGATSNRAIRIVGGSDTFQFAMKLAKASYNDVGGHTTLIGLGCENAAWSRSAIGHTRTTSYDAGYLGFYVSNNNADATELLQSDLRMMINRDGNVGIGTTAPISKLQVNGQFRQLYSRAFISNPLDTDGYAGHIIVNSNNANGDLAGIGLYTNSSYNAAAGLFALQESSTAASMVFYAGSNLSTERMRITSGGNVGIGTASVSNFFTVVTNLGGSPANLSELEPYSAVKIKARSDRDNILYIGAKDALTGMLLQSGTTSTAADLLLNPFGGNVGIGTTSPSSKLHIQTSSGDGLRIITADVATIKMGSTTGGTSHWGFATTNLVASDFGIYQSNSGGGDPITAGTPRLYFNASGNVGIGTTTPGSKLTVAGSAIAISNGWTGAHDILFVGGSPNSTGGASSTAARIRSTASAPGGAATGDLMFTVNRGDSFVDAIYINPNGNVGIGTTNPTNNLTVEDTIGIKRAGVGAVSTIQQTGTGLIVNAPNGYHPLVIQHNSSELFRFTNGGNLGIGTTSPIAKLHISSSGTPLAAALQGDSKLVVSGVDGNMDLLSLDDNSTVANSIGFGRFNSSTGALIHKFGITAWANTGSTGSNTGDRIAFNYGTLADAWSNSELMTIKSNGYVGIGTTNPANRLQIGSIGSSGYGGNDIVMGNGTQVMAFFQSSTASTWYTNNNFALMPAGVGAIGNVGIGTDSPSTRLHVSGVITATGGNSTNWNTAYGWGNHATAGYFKLEGTEPITIQAETVTFTGSIVVEGTITESSSIRFKENITPLDPALDKVNQLEAVSYNKIGADDREIGLIAEEVAELFPEVVTYNEEGQPQGIQYQRLSVILLKAVQELTERVNKLENK